MGRRGPLYIHLFNLFTIYLIPLSDGWVESYDPISTHIYRADFLHSYVFSLAIQYLVNQQLIENNMDVKNI